MGAPPNSLPPLPLQGGNQPTPATSPAAPMSGVMNLIKAIQSGLQNVGTGGASQMEKQREGFAEKQAERGEVTGLAEQQAQAGQPIDVAAFVAAGGNPNLGQWLAETSKQKATQNAQFGTAVNAIPGLSDQTKALMAAGLASGDPKQEGLIKGLMGDLMAQQKIAGELAGRQVTAQGGIERAKVAGQAGIKERQITAGATDRRTQEMERSNIRTNAVREDLAKVAATAKKGGADAIGKAEAKLSTAYKQTLKPDADGNYSNIDNYNNTTVQSLPFKNAVNNYMFKDADGKPITQPGITGAANTFFGDKKAAAGFLNTFNTDISKMSDPRAIASAVDAHLQEAVARGKIDPSNRDQMMKQLLAAVQLSLQNAQQQAQEGVATRSTFVQPDNSNDETEDEKKDNDPNTADETNDND